MEAVASNVMRCIPNHDSKVCDTHCRWLEEGEEEGGGGATGWLPSPPPRLLLNTEPCGAYVDEGYVLGRKVSTPEPSKLCGENIIFSFIMEGSSYIKLTVTPLPW